MYCIIKSALLPLAFVASTCAFAGNVPDSAFYVGLGASASNVSYQNQNITAVGISDVYSTSNGQLISSGSAGGPPVNVNLGSSTTIAPSIQAGYFKKFDESSYLWGAKFAYTYNNTSSTSSAFLVPQYGAFGSTPFTGNAIMQSYSSTLQQQIGFLPYLGKSFNDAYLYLGVGPTLSQVTSKVNGVVGFADINGQRSDISGSPQSFTANNWVWGWQASVGGTYFLDKEWFLEAGYTYGMTANYTANMSGPFTNVSASSGRTYTGSLIGAASGYLTTNIVTVSINKAF